MAQEFKIGRLRFTWRSQWTPATAYAKDDVVGYQGKTYTCLTPHTSDASNFYNNSANWSIILDGKTFTGNWATSVFYSLGNITVVGGVIYYCTTPHTSTTFASQTSNWVEYTQFTSWRIVWAPSTSYLPGDTVRYGGIVYQCNTAHTSASTVALGLENDQAKWTTIDAGVIYTGTWASSVRYRINDIAQVGANLYICTVYHTSGVSFTSANWTVYIPDQQFLASFNASGVYQVGDVIIYGGNVYVSSVSNNTSNVPSTSPASWTLLIPGNYLANDWINSATYTIGTLVRRNGLLYQAVADNTSQDPAAFSISTTYNSSGSSGTTLVVASTTGIVPGSNVIGVGFTQGQSVTSVTNSTTLVLNYPPDGTPVNGQTLSFVGVNYVSWKMVIPETYWANKWTSATLYQPGDLVVYAKDTYKCIQQHTASAGNRPDADTTNTYWVEYIAHVRKNALTNTGDLEYFNATTNSYNALPIGPQGYVLRTNTNTPAWTQINTVTNVFYVSVLTGTDATGYGSSWDRPWQSIQYAASRVAAGLYNPYVTAILTANKTWLQAEMVAWANYQISNNLSPYTTSYAFNSTKAARDAGIIIDGIIYDLARGGNSQTVANAKSFFAYQSTNTFYNTGVANGMPYFIPMLTYLRTLIQNAVAETAPGTNYQALTGVTQPVYQVTNLTSAEGGTSATATTLINYVITALTNQSTTLLPTENQGIAVTIYVKTGTYLETLPIIVPANCAIIGDELRGVVVLPKVTISTVATATSSSSKLVTVNSTAGLVDNMPVQFMAPKVNTVSLVTSSLTFVPFGGITAGTTYYVVGSTVTGTQFGIAASPTTSFTGTTTQNSSTITDVSSIIGLAVGATITGAGIPNNTTITSITSAPTNSSLNSISISNAATQTNINTSITAVGARVSLTDGAGSMQVYGGDCLRDMFRCRNGTGVRNMTLAGLVGTLKTPDAFSIQEPTGGSYAAFDTGTGPNDSNAWITRRSPYFQNVTTFGFCATGAKIDGNLHNGGVKSMVFNDFTQIIQDGVGIWCTGPGALTECISVFCYYGYTGYYASGGGRIRAANGNSSYGQYGVIASGFDSTETPVTGVVFNQSTQVQASVQSSLGSNAQLIKFNYNNAGSAYTIPTTNLLQYSNSFSVSSAWTSDGNLIFDKVGLAPTGYNEATYLTGTGGTGTGYIYQNVAVPPAGATYTNVPATTISGIGAGATFNVTITNTSYVVTVNQGGAGYAPGNQVYIQGSVLGGKNVTNDLTLTVNTVAGNAILSVVSSGTVPAGSAQSYTASVYVYQGTATQLDIQAIYSGNTSMTSAVNYNFTTGVVTPSNANGGFLPVQYGAQVTLTPGWYRLWFAFQDAAGLNTQIQIRIYPKGINGSANTLNYMYGAQLEKTSQAGGVPGFYLETQASTYTAYANFNIQGAGVNGFVVADELRSNAVFQSLVTSSGNGYLTSSNQAQGGTSQYVTLSQSDVNQQSNYIGMRVFISSGTGSGQYGYVSSYNTTSKQLGVLKESFAPLQIASTSSVTNAVTLNSSFATNLLYVNMPIQFIPVYYATTVNSTSLAQTTATATVGGSTNYMTVSSTLGMYVNMPITFTGTVFGGVNIGYTYYVYSIIDSVTIQLSTQAFGTVWSLLSATGSMVANFTSGTSYLQGSTTNMQPNLPIQFTGNNLGGLTIGTTYYICDVIDSNNFTLATSTNNYTVTATSSTNNGLTVSSTAGMQVLNPIVFAAPAIVGSNIIDSTKYYISSIIDINTFTVSSSIIQQSVQATTGATNYITTTSTTGFVINQPIIFTGTSFGNIQAETVYYVLAVINSTQFTVSQTVGGGALSLSTATGNMILRTCPAPFSLATATGSMVGTTTNAKKSVTLGIGTMNAQFSTSLFGGVSAGTTYYITSLVTTGIGGSFTISTTQGGANVTLLTKTGTMNLAAVGWDHVTPGFPIVPSLDSTTVYYIEPRVTFTIPPFTQTTSGSLILPTLGVGVNWSVLSYGNGLFLALPSSSNIYATSPDGINWTQGALPFSGYWTGAAYGNGSWVLISSASVNAAVTNSTGAGWRTATLPTTGFTQLTYGNGKFVAIASGTTTAIYSTNYGLNWTTATLPVSQVWTSLAYGSGIYVAVASSTQNAVRSANGINWTTVTMPTSSIWTSVTFGNGRFVAVASDGSPAAYSFDGITWYQSNLPVAANTVVYGQGTFVALGAGTTAYQSENCIDWAPRAVNNNTVTLSAYGLNPSGVGIFVDIGSSGADAFSAGARAKGRPVITTNALTFVTQFEPGSGYFSGVPGVSGSVSAPTMALTDPNVTSLASVTNRIGNGALGNPTFINKGSGYNSTTTTVAITGNGYADTYQTGYSIILNNLNQLPTPGANLEFAGSTTVYKVTSATAVYGTTAPNIEALINITPSISLANSPTNGTIASIRLKYSQARLTNHDFLNIGYGDLDTSNYPTSYPDTGYASFPNQQTVEVNYGRVFYTSTDQDGNFKVGNLFGVQQATGIVTLSASQFGLQGLNAISIGGISVGGSLTTITQFSTDGTFTANSDSVVPTQKAIATYLASRLSQGGSNTYTGQITAGTVLIGGPSYIKSSIPNGQVGSSVKMANKVYFGGQAGSGAGSSGGGVDGNLMAYDFFFRGGTRRSVPPLPQ